MEMIGKVLKLKSTDSVSVHHTTQYKKLRQDVTDDERDDEDDDVVFLRRGIELRQQNGFDADHVKRSSDSDGDLKPSKRMRSSDSLKVKQGIQKKRATRKRPIVLLLTLVVTMVTASALVALALLRHGNSRASRIWIQEFVDSEGSSNIALHDVDGDGIFDIIVGLVRSNNVSSTHTRPSSQNDHPCKLKETENSCSGRLVCLRGEDGEILWEIMTPFNVGEINCGSIDINQDGSMDCIASGLFNGLLGFSPRTGRLIWSSNSSIMNRDWSMVGMETLSDVNDDGIVDLVVMQSRQDDSQNNTDDNSMLLLVDGHTGSVLGRPIKIKEGSKFKLTVHKFKDRPVYVVYGTGSSIARGSLFAMSARDFHSAVMSSSDSNKPHITDSSAFEISRNHFLGFTNNGGVINILSNHHGHHGVIIPPLFFDADANGNEDMVVASCDGNITMFGGSDNRIIWSLSFSEHHVTRPMVCGYLNDDVYPDILVYLNIKPNSNITSPSSVVAVLSGMTGSILWSLNDTAIEFHAPNVRASTTDNRRDIFAFWLKRQTISDIPIKKVKRNARSLEMPSRTKANARSRGRLPSYEDYVTYNRGPQFLDGGNAYNQGDGDYRSEYGSDPDDQPLPNRNRPYPSEYYNPHDDDEDDTNDHRQDVMLKNRFGTNKALTSTHSTPIISSTHFPTIQSECRSLAEQLFLVGLDRYSATDPFIILREDAVSLDEMDGISNESLSSPALKSSHRTSQSRCPLSLIQSTTGILYDINNDQRVELISATTFTASDRLPRDLPSKSIKLFRVSKLDIQSLLSEVIDKRRQSLTSPTMADDSPLKASRTMTVNDLGHYAGFELKQPAQRGRADSDQ